MLGLQDSVAVYFPQSYAFAGNTIVVPASRVTRLDAVSSDVMAFVVSGGVTEVPRINDMMARKYSFVAALSLPVAMLAQRGGGTVPAGMTRATRSCCSSPRPYGTAIDDAPHAGWTVLVRGDRIDAVGPAAQVRTPAGATVIELPGMTLLPGLIEAHSHVLLHPYNEAQWNDQVLKEPLALRTARATVALRNTLMAGFTTIRDLGTEGAGYADVGLKQAVNQGIIPGPRMYVVTRAIVATRQLRAAARRFLVRSRRRAHKRRTGPRT